MERYKQLTEIDRNLQRHIMRKSKQLNKYGNYGDKLFKELNSNMQKVDSILYQKYGNFYGTWETFQNDLGAGIILSFHIISKSDVKKYVKDIIPILDKITDLYPDFLKAKDIKTRNIEDSVTELHFEVEWDDDIFYDD